ncbi:uncharacterized protein LOC135215682 isoform X1 [Macrobrachium nipponense]|uniref:uncharacterized protein LOC135215682 isoform X1 n=1 Tax=Macrobrachium nipponense TaxID=159736 RepID=UPI0030C89FE0
MGRTRLSLLWAAILLSAKALGTRAAGDTANETASEEDLFEDPLEKWLENFHTYTFMIEQDVGDKSPVAEGDEATAGPEEPSTSEEDLTLGEEDYDQGSSAPIAISIKKYGSLLDPNVDYKLKIESLVAEEGSVLISLESIENKTACGVGGFSLHPVEEVESVDSEDLQQLDGTGTDGAAGQRRKASHRLRGSTTRSPVVAFAVDTEAENMTTWTVGDDAGSEWTEHSKDLWWAMGRLDGGGGLTLVFTPPECGCLVLKAYYALPIGDNVTLVVGPESYPSDLEKLLCVDPSVSSIEENLIETETEDVGLEQEDEPSPSRGSGAGPTEASKKGPKGRGSVNARRKTRLQKKKRRQEARQAIRQAGKRVTRKRVRAHLRLRRKGEQTDEEDRRVKPAGGKWARKQARRMARKQEKKERKAWKGKKPWKKHRKHARRNRNRHNKANRHQNRNQNSTEGLDEDAYDDHLNATTEPPTEEDTLAELLLGDEAEQEDPEETDDAESGDEVPVHRRGRKQRRQKGRRARKMKNKEKRKGTKFCCKQGIKYKKSQLNANSTDETDQPEIPCDNINDVVTTFALHQFGVDDAHCSSRYETCCSKFTRELWENVRAKKAARKAKRKQQRKSNRQEKRRQNRRHRSSTTPATTSTTSN